MVAVVNSSYQRLFPFVSGSDAGEWCLANLNVAQNSTIQFFPKWPEMAISLGLDDRITSINDTMADTEAKYHDQLCALDVLCQWMQRRNPTVDEMLSAFDPYVLKLKRGMSAQPVQGTCTCM